MLSSIFKNYLKSKPVTAGDVANKIVPDIERIVEQQKISESEVANCFSKLTKITTSPFAPSSPREGDIWINTSS